MAFPVHVFEQCVLGGNASIDCQGLTDNPSVNCTFEEGGCGFTTEAGTEEWHSVMPESNSFASRPDENRKPQFL